MKPISFIIVLGTAAAAVVGCSVRETRYAPAPQATYAPAPQAIYYDPPNYQRSNVYSSRWDYYRNYQGIHGGPERTGP